ncbi:MAG TPA: response regulator, partial [Terriglobales bacterium]|nr:response regulator [Terriglobales bacterium]
TLFKTKKGVAIPVAISASIIYDDEGQETGSIGFAKDIREIRRRDQLVTLAEIAIGLSHEVNNSLEVLVNHIELFQKYVERAATDEDYIVEIERLESIATEVKKIQATTGRISKMAEEGQYGTKEYLAGRLMTDLRMGDGEEKSQRLKPDDRRPLTGLRVLVVDDDLAVCRSLTDLLESEGCKVDTAHSGVQGLERLWTREFDVVLSDVVMPDMNGFELYKKVKKHAPHLPVVLMTAFNYDKDHVIKHSCLEGLQGVIFKKPVNPALLKKTLLEQCCSKDSWGKSPVHSQRDSRLVDNPKTH